MFSGAGSTPLNWDVVGGFGPSAIKTTQCALSPARLAVPIRPEFGCRHINVTSRARWLVLNTWLTLLSRSRPLLFSDGNLLWICETKAVLLTSTSSTCMTSNALASKRANDSANEAKVSWKRLLSAHTTIKLTWVDPTDFKTFQEICVPSKIVRVVFELLSSRQLYTHCS